MTDPRSGGSGADEPAVDDPPPDAGGREEYPPWWRRNVDEFRRYDLPPYRPPRFEDGELVPQVLAALEDDLGVPIQLRVVDPQEGNRWQVVVDGSPVAAVDRERHDEGYSVFHLTAGELEGLVRDSR